MDRVERESFRLFCPGFADGLVGREAFERLQSSREVVGCYEVGEVRCELIVCVVVKALDGRFLDRPVHAFDLSVRPRVLRLRQSMFDAKLLAGAIEGMSAEPGCWTKPILRQVGKLDAVVRQHRVDFVWDCRHQRFEEAAGGGGVGGLCKLDERELGRSVDGDEEMELAFRRAHLGNVDMEEADRIGLELALGRLVAIDVGQPRDAVALQTAMQGRARQMRDRRLQCVEAVVERQQRVPPKGNHDRLVLNR